MPLSDLMESVGGADNCVIAGALSEVTVNLIHVNMSSLLVTSSMLPDIELAPLVNKASHTCIIISARF